jgi:hypothetical protein
MGKRKGVYKALVKNHLRGGGHFEDPGINGRIILKWIFDRLDGGINWIDLAQDKERWRAFLNMVMNLRVP